MRIDWGRYDEKKAREIAKRFGKSTIAEMQSEINRLSLVDKGNLLNSLKVSVFSSNNEVNRITFSYAFYGRFFENGARNVFGKGVSIQPTSWRSKSIELHKQKLDQEFTEMYAQLIAEEINIESVKMKM